MTDLSNTFFTHLPADIQKIIAEKLRAPEITISPCEYPSPYIPPRPQIHIRSTITIRIPLEIPSQFNTDAGSVFYSFDAVEVEKFISRCRKFRQRVIEKLEWHFYLNDDVSLTISGKNPTFSIEGSEDNLNIDVCQETMLALIDHIINYLVALTEKYK